MMDIILKLTDEEMTIISNFMQIGIMAVEDFNEIDYEEWGVDAEQRKKAREIMKELDKTVICEYLLYSMGDAWK